MARRLFLRLIEKTPSQVPLHLKSVLVRQAVEGLIEIEWELLPEIDSRGGFSMVGFVPDSIDFEVLAIGLEGAGYTNVI